MNRLLVRIIAGLAMALALVGAPQTASAAPLANRTIRITYCWSLTSFGPSGCNANWPSSAPVALVGSGNSGPAVLPTSLTTSVTGTFAFASNQNNLTIQFINPTPGVLRATYSGSRYPGGASNCYRGPMQAVRATGPAMNGVWMGCVLP